MAAPAKEGGGGASTAWRQQPWQGREEKGRSRQGGSRGEGGGMWVGLVRTAGQGGAQRDGSHGQRFSFFKK